MIIWRRTPGLDVTPPGSRLAPGSPETREITEEAALFAPAGDDLRVDVLVEEGARVAQGAPVLALRRAPSVRFVAPMAAEVASIRLAPGHRLSELRFFREAGAGRHAHDLAGAESSAGRLAEVLQACGCWHLIRSRPFGRIPGPQERPAAIFVMALDTRPAAPDPRQALSGREEDLARGLAALSVLTEGPVYLCQEAGPALLPGEIDRVRVLKAPNVHPVGSAGFLLHGTHPPTLERSVWEVHAEDVAGIGELLRTGQVPETRLVSVAGPALQRPRLVRCQPGADLRALAMAEARPGPLEVLTGSVLEGRRSGWLGARDRQLTALVRDEQSGGRHWLLSALEGAARPLPVIPTAALDQALGGLPAVPFLRAVAAGDRETAVQLGALSLLGEDMALADYVSGAEPSFAAFLDEILRGISAELTM